MKPPPLLVSFIDGGQYIASLSPKERGLYGDDVRRLLDRGLPPAVSTRCLATLFGFSPKFVGAMARRPEGYYRTFTIPKGNGRRTIHAPKVSLKVVQAWFGFHLSEVAVPSEHAYGFVRGRSTVMAAAQHCPSEWVLSLDIKDFFQTTPCEKVAGSLRGLGFPSHGAELMARLCCYQAGLAQGSPASPALSNLVFQPIDERLASLAREFGVRYTRYADDLVFSGQEDCPSGLQRAVEQIVSDAGWTISAKKTLLARRPTRLKVHGLLVDGSRPRLTKGYRHRIRAFQHLMEDGKIASEDIPRVRGHIAYARSVSNFK